MKKFLKSSILSLLFSFFAVATVYATDAQPVLSGAAVVESGKTFNVELYGNNINGAGLMTVGGVVSTSDSTCLQFVSVNVPQGEGLSNKNKFAWQYPLGKTSNSKLAIITLKAVGTNCSASVSVSDIEFSFTDSTKLKKGSQSKTIKVVTYSTNNNLASLSVDKGSLSPGFSADNTNYTVNVGNDVSNINISASPADAKATVAGTGSKTIKFGSNKFSITVKAENGSVKTYNINIIREDNRSSNANLSSLSLSSGTLSPSFNQNVTEYTVSVPYEVGNIKVNATPVDATSKVSISSPDLVAEGTTNIVIKVTAENGATKTYIIKATRGKDPNKVLSTDNNLTSLIPSVGMLSPSFDQNKTNYYIYLPYEIEDISFTYEVSDKKYATTKLNGPNKLKPDSANKYTISVTAENESVKDYVITVYRAKNPEDINAVHGIGDPSGIPKLKNIKINNGKLLTKFDTNITTYEYTKKKGFSYEYELEDENTYVNVIEQGSTIYFVLESETGDMNIYCLHLKEPNYLLIILITIIILLLGIITILIIKSHKKEKDSDKKKEPSNAEKVKKVSKKQ